MVTVALDKHNSAFVLQGKVQSGGHRISKGNGVYSSVFSVLSSNVNHVIAFADSIDWGLGGDFLLPPLLFKVLFFTAAVKSVFDRYESLGFALVRLVSMTLAFFLFPSSAAMA